MDLIVDTARRRLSFAGADMDCLIGRGGAVPAGTKEEGDGATPLGRWPLLTVLLRPDRTAPPPRLALPWRWLHPQDGWSDAPEDPEYNRPVRHPHRHSAERLWREDGLYDVIVTTAHNTPPAPGAGSAIFLHCRAAKDHTAGCIAVDKPLLLDMLGRLKPGAALDIR